MDDYLDELLELRAAEQDVLQPGWALQSSKASSAGSSTSCSAARNSSSSSK